jgi:hypothetical protein
MGATINGIKVGGGVSLDSPAFTGIPTAPTAAVGTNTTQLATTEFVQGSVWGNIDGGTPSSTYGGNNVINCGGAS